MTKKNKAKAIIYLAFQLISVLSGIGGLLVIAGEKPDELWGVSILLGVLLFVFAFLLNRLSEEIKESILKDIRN